MTRRPPQIFADHYHAAGHRRNNMDFLRVLLATLVVYSHAYQILLGGLEALDPLYRFTLGQQSFGHFAVNFFFIMSGYLIAQSWCRAPRLGDFFRNRSLRIYPAFIVGMLFCWLVVVPLAAGTFHGVVTVRQTARVLAQMAILHPFGSPLTVFATHPMPTMVNGPMWTIRHEFWCYVTVALIGYVGLLRRPRVTLGILIGIFAAYQVVSYLQETTGTPVLSWGYAEYVLGAMAQWPRLLTYFLAGSVFYLYRDRIFYSPWIVIACLIGALAACRIPHALNAVLPVAGTYLIFTFAFHPRVPLQHFGTYGDFSYGIYLYAFPVQQLLYQWLGPWKGPLAHFALAMVITLGLAFASWHVVEKHFLRMKARRARASAAPTPAVAVASPTARASM